MLSLSVEIIIFHIQKRFEKLLDSLNWSKQTVNIFEMYSCDINWSLQKVLKMHVKHLFFSIPLYTPSLYPFYTPCSFLHEDLKRPRQWLLWTFKPQQRYLQVSTKSNDYFQTVFDVIQNILESIFDIVMWQRQITSSTMKLLEFSIPLKNQHLSKFCAFKNHFLCFKCFWKVSWRVLLVKRNQKHIYNMYVGPKPKFVVTLENDDFTQNLPHP